MRVTGGLRRAAVAAVLGVIVLSVPAAANDDPPPPPTGYLPAATGQLLAEVNKHRRARGLHALTVHSGLAAQARAWAERMANTGTLAHNDALFSADSRRRLGLRLLGENVGVNTGVVAQHKAFLASSGHRRNVEYASFRVAGFAVVRDANGRIWSVEDFGAA